MTYLEWLKKGSEFHNVKCNPDESIVITPAGESPECEREFERIVEEAYSHASSEGFEVTHVHRNRMRSSALHPEGDGPYDMVVLAIV
jgi:hypothetical protein